MGQTARCLLRLGCVVERSGTDFTHTLQALLFSKRNRISPTNRSVCNAHRTESLVQYEYAYRYTPNIYIYI